MSRTEHASGPEAMEKYLEEFKKVIDADGFMSAVWEVRDGRIALTCCTSHNFPLGDRAIAEAQFHEVNQEEAKVAMLPPPPLPIAAFRGDGRMDSFRESLAEKAEPSNSEMTQVRATTREPIDDPMRSDDRVEEAPDENS